MKCPKCGYENVGGGTKCGKCGKPFKVDKISCPKCATINDGNAIKCSKCGYRFNTKRITVLIVNLLISLTLVIVLLALLHFDKLSWIKNVNKGAKIAAAVSILLIGIGTLTFRREDALDKNIPELQAAKRQFKGLRIFSQISMTILGLLLIGIALYLITKYLI